MFFLAAPKPFVELSFVQRISEFSTVPEVEYLRILVQEFAVRVDQVSLSFLDSKKLYFVFSILCIVLL